MDFIYGFFTGLFAFLIYFTIRAMKSGHFDKSNLLNPVRAISFMAAHADVIPYLRNTREPDDAPFKKKYPFWYARYDEFKEIVTTVGEPDYTFKNGDDPLDQGKPGVKMGDI